MIRAILFRCPTNYSISLLSVSLSCSKPEEKLSWRDEFTPCRWRRGNGTPLVRMWSPNLSLLSQGKVCLPVVTYSAFTHTAVQQRKHWSWVPSIWTPNCR